MNCSSCKQTIMDGSVYCNFCGTRQRESMQKFYQNTKGCWEVTTEGDVEGRTISKFGVFEGHIDDIAKYLFAKKCYSLTFKAVVPKTIDSIVTVGNKELSIPVNFDYESNIHSMSSMEKAFFLKQLFKDRPVEVIPGGGYGDFTIKF